MENLEQKILEAMSNLYVLNEVNMIRPSDAKFIANYLQLDPRSLEGQVMFSNENGESHTRIIEIKNVPKNQIDLEDMINEVESENGIVTKINITNSGAPSQYKPTNNK